VKQMPRRLIVSHRLTVGKNCAIVAFQAPTHHTRGATVVHALLGGVTPKHGVERERGSGTGDGHLVSAAFHDNNSLLAGSSLQ